jgi:hypothetical protein|tara:strand:+ start:5838 stop:6452 length:615 start_codon:yes stop_codon:yes gene_type:complete
MSSESKLLTSWQPFEYNIDSIKESKLQHDGKILMKGVLQKADTLNQNGRIYPRPILEREVRNYQKFIQENRALGECDHPDTSVVELKNASHIIREAHMDGDVCYGTVELLDTPSGNILQKLVEAGVTLGISSRGVGSTRNEGDYVVVQDDFQLICWDFVSEPSTPGAFMMREGKDISPRELKKVFTKSDRLYRIYNDITGWKNG